MKTLLAIALSLVFCVAAEARSLPKPTIGALGVQAPVRTAQAIGQVKSAPPAQSFTLVQVTGAVCPTYFTINNSGVLSITAAGATAINALTTSKVCSLIVTATNSAGTGTGTVTINIAAQVQPPVVQNLTVNVAAPVTSGQSVGTVSATGATGLTVSGGSP